MRDDVVQIDRIGARPVVVADHQRAIDETIRAAIENAPDGEIVKVEPLPGGTEWAESQLAGLTDEQKRSLAKRIAGDQPMLQWRNYTSQYTEVSKEELIARFNAAHAKRLAEVGDGGPLCDDDDEADEPITVRGGQ